MRLSLTTMFVLIILCLCCYTKSIRLGKREESVPKETLREFESAPENGRYDNVIEMPHTASKLIQKIFIWCPIRHSGLTIECPVHNCPLKIGMWTDVLYGLRTDPRNPRLIYDLNGNLLLVQAFYECSYRLDGHSKNGHRYLSASNEILQLLPPGISRRFPIIMRQRCGFTLHLYVYVISGIYQGQNFMELSEGIAGMNFRQLMRNNPDSVNVKDEFERSVFCSYPSNDNLIDVSTTISNDKGTLRKRHV